MNKNQILTTGWSNKESQQLFAAQWPHEAALRAQYENGDQCGGCSFFAAFNEDWGLCCNPQSRHQLETVFEHFTCPNYVRECWGPHSFTTNANFHCRCGGESAEYWDNLMRVFKETSQKES